MNSSSTPAPREPQHREPENQGSAPTTMASPLHVVLHGARPGSRLLLALGWLGFLVCILLLLRQWSAQRDYFNTTQGIHERFHSGEPSGGQKVAIIAVRGVILEGDGFVKQQIDRVRDDPRVKAVVLRSRFARRYGHRLGLYLPPLEPPASGAEHPLGGQHGQHRRQRWLLRIDGRG